MTGDRKAGAPVTAEEAAVARQAARDAGYALTLPPLDLDAIRAQMDAARTAAAEAGDPAPHQCWHQHPVAGCFGCGRWRRWKERWVP